MHRIFTRNEHSVQTGRGSAVQSSVLWTVATCLVVMFFSCGPLFTEQVDADSTLDGPLQGLNDSQLKLHIDGDAEFNTVHTAQDGLGPIFNAQSCVACHLSDGRGHSSTTLLRFGRNLGTGFDGLVAYGGPQLQDKAIPGYTPETVPVEAGVFSRFLPPAVTGLGFLDAVDDSTLLANEDPLDRNGDGISGIASRVEAPAFLDFANNRRLDAGKAIGRFGRKAAAVDLLHQTVNAFINDMGLSSDFHPEDIYNVAVGRHSGDRIADPEVSAGRVRVIVWYLRTLKAPPRHNQTDATVLEGERTFTTIGCASCHSPTMRTGVSDIGSLSSVEFHPYTDLLLHDMGSELNDGYTEGSALPTEWRTTPLWGLGLSAQATGSHPTFLHDGRATTIQQAIELHGGEAATSRRNFLQLDAVQKAALMKFLESL